MPRCFYYAFRDRRGIPQILTSTVAHPQHFTPLNTKLLPERQDIWNTHSLTLEWCLQEGTVTQAAIALLAHATTAPILTRRYAEQFQTEILNPLPPQGWLLQADQIRSWVARQRRHAQTLQQQTSVLDRCLLEVDAELAFVPMGIEPDE